MARRVKIDEVQLLLKVPADIPDGLAVRAYRVLVSSLFMNRLRRAIRAVLARHPELCDVTLKVSR